MSGRQRIFGLGAFVDAIANLMGIVVVSNLLCEDGVECDNNKDAER